MRIKGQINNEDVIVGVSCRPPIQSDDTDELLFEKLMDTSKSTSVSFPEINWKNHTVQPRPEDS